MEISKVERFMDGRGALGHGDLGFTQGPGMAATVGSWESFQKEFGDREGESSELASGIVGLVAKADSELRKRTPVHSDSSYCCL